MYYIYKITNLINGKLYIGQTNNFKKRCKDHKGDIKRSNLPIHNSMKKHGIENFKFEIIEECATREEANIREPLYIKEYNSLIPTGYNIENGGQVNKMSEETKLKISLTKIGRPSPNKGKPSPLKGTKMSEEQKLKISKALTGKLRSPEHSKNISIAKIGKTLPSEPFSKLTKDQVLKIRKLYKENNITQRELAEQFSISQSSINEIILYKTWKHLLDE